MDNLLATQTYQPLNAANGCANPLPTRTTLGELPTVLNARRGLSPKEAATKAWEEISGKLSDIVDIFTTGGTQAIKDYDDLAASGAELCKRLAPNSLQSVRLQPMGGGSKPWRGNLACNFQNLAGVTGDDGKSKGYHLNALIPESGLRKPEIRLLPNADGTIQVTPIPGQRFDVSSNVRKDLETLLNDTQQRETALDQLRKMIKPERVNDPSWAITLQQVRGLIAILEHSTKVVVLR
jgi:hypothetical protein